MEEKIMENLKEFAIVCLKVLERFPEIKKEEICVEYNPSIKYSNLLVTDSGLMFVVGPYFFDDLDEGEKEATVAHELGHYKGNCDDEVYADNEARKAGYGPQMISFLEKIVEKRSDQFPQMVKDEIRTRIINLEKKIEY